jgi:hypothetical protein
MSRRTVAWLVCLALMAVGSVFAHAAAYTFAAPTLGSHAGMNHPHGHSVFPHLESCLAVCAAVALGGLFASLAGRLSGGRRLVAPLWVFALVPPIGFFVQEHVEHLLRTGVFPAGAVLEPTFVVGLVLQLPFALAAFVVARALLGLAQAIVELLRAAPRPLLEAPEPRLLPAYAVAPPRISALALGHGQRAPPAGLR